MNAQRIFRMIGVAALAVSTFMPFTPANPAYAEGERIDGPVYNGNGSTIIRRYLNFDTNSGWVDAVALQPGQTWDIFVKYGSDGRKTEAQSAWGNYSSEQSIRFGLLKEFWEVVCLDFPGEQWTVTHGQGGPAQFFPDCRRPTWEDAAVVAQAPPPAPVVYSAPAPAPAPSAGWYCPTSDMTWRALDPGEKLPPNVAANVREDHKDDLTIRLYMTNNSPDLVAGHAYDGNGDHNRAIWIRCTGLPWSHQEFDLRNESRENRCAKSVGWAPRRMWFNHVEINPGC